MKNKMRYLILILSLALLCSFFTACYQNTYSDTLTAQDVSQAARAQVSDGGEYLEYSADDISYMLGDNSGIKDCSVLYSPSSDDISEIGVLHAHSNEEAEQLLKAAEKYINELKATKTEFLRNYAPGELDKLENARVQRFGQYVVFTVLSPESSSRVLATVEEMLKK